MTRGGFVKTSRLFTIPTSLFFVLALSCVYPTHDNDRAAQLEEWHSVWQYLNVFSIYQDKIPPAPGKHSPEELFDMISDSLGGIRYTEYVDDRLGWDDDDWDDWWDNIGFVWCGITSPIMTRSTLIFSIPTMHDCILDDFNYYMDFISGFQNIVIDLRDNLGGYLDVAHHILAEFLPYGTEYIHETGRYYDRELRQGFTESRKLKTTIKNPRLLNKNVAVLMNGNTASAAEILASGMKDAHGAYLIGSQSYGKGIGAGEYKRTGRKTLRITTHGLSGISSRTGDYHKVGLVPDDVPEEYVIEAEPILRVRLDQAIERNPDVYGDLLDDTAAYEETLKYWLEDYSAIKMLDPSYTLPPLDPAPQGGMPKSAEWQRQEREIEAMALKAYRMAKRARTADLRPRGTIVRIEPDLLK